MAKFQEIESAVVSLDKQVKVLTADLQKLITTVNSNSKGQSDLANKTKTVTKAVNQVSAVEKELERIRKAGLKVTKETIAAKEKLRQKTKALTDAERKANGTVKKSGGLFRSMTKSILTAGAAMLGLRAAFNVIKNGLKNIIAFEKAMSEVKAITGATDKEFKALESNAALLGSTTAKTAIEVSGLQKEFAKLGFSTAEILAATEATINLSIAAGSDLAESAVVAASTIRGFGLSATESTRVVDVMAKSFTSSALDLEKFKIAMSKVAPVAKASGKDIEFATSQLAILSDAGLEASIAGTSLRNMFLELNKQGLTWEEGLEKINTSTNKNVTALDLFGKRGATAALILADNIDKAGELEVALDGAAGAAKDMADIMEDNLAGDITKAKSAWEGLVLSISSGSGIINTSLRGIVKVSTQALTAITSMGLFYKRASKLTEQDAQRILTSLENVSIGVSNRIKTSSEALKNATKSEVIPAMNELSQALQDQGLSFEKSQKIAVIAAKNRANQLKAIQEAEKEAEIKAAEEAARVKEQIASDSANKIAEEQLKIDEEVEQERLTAYQEAKQAQEELNSKADQDRLEREKEQLVEQLAEEYELKVLAAEKELLLAEVTAEQKKRVKIAAVEAAEQIVSDRLSLGIDENLAKFQSEQDASADILKDRLDKGEISEKEYAKEIAEIERKGRIESAKAEKKKAILDATLAAAVSVIKQLAATPLPLGAPFILSAAKIGALQIGVAAAIPIPKFKHGSNGQLQLDTTAIVGDGGKPELITTPKGDFLSPSTDTMVHLPRGSQVFGGDSPETQAALSGGMSDEHYNGLIKSNNRIEKAVKSKNNYPIITRDGLERILENRNGKNRYLDNFR